MRFWLAVFLLVASACNPGPTSTPAGKTSISPIGPSARAPYQGPHPEGGYFVGVAYDAVRRETVVLDSRVHNLPTDFETWTWNGTTWKRLHPVTSPGTVLSLAFDAARQRVVGFGKPAFTNADSVRPGETWTWDGETWQKESPEIQPTGRQQPILVYDSKRQRVVMLGGVGRPNEQLTDVWAWDGSNWGRLPDIPGTTFGPRDGTYDPIRDQVVMFQPTGDLETRLMLIFDGVVWSQRTITNQDLPMQGSLSFDPMRRQVMLFGLQVDSTSHPVNSIGGPPSTWGWNGTNWLNLDIGTGPFNRGFSRLAYDSGRRVFVLFGGVSFGPTNSQVPSPGTCCTVAAANDVWEFDGRRWTQRA